MAALAAAAVVICAWVMGSSYRVSAGLTPWWEVAVIDCAIVLVLVGALARELRERSKSSEVVEPYGGSVAGLAEAMRRGVDKETGVGRPGGGPDPDD